GHKLLKQGQCASAAAIFVELARVPDCGPRAYIMLALAQAGLSHYSTAFSLLQKTPCLQASLGAALYDVIVQSRMGFKDDAIQDLLAIVNEHKQMLTSCLWLGDLLAARNQVDNAVKCWRLAVNRDHS